MQRRSFLKKASLGAVAGTATVAAPVFAQDAPTLNWRLASSFTRGLDTLFGTSEMFCRYVTEATGGKFNIRNFPGGEIVPPLQVLDAVEKNTVEMGHSCGYYYYGKDPILCFDTAVPFGLNARQMNAWMYEGDGMKLTREAYSKYNIVNFPMGNTGVQMGGWYRKEIKTVDDLKGLKMRTAGFAGNVLARLGVVPQQIAAGDIYPSLEKGTLDAVEFVGPYDDEKLGFFKVAKHYYYPGWWEGGPQLSFYVNQASWKSLPEVYRQAFEVASAEANQLMLAQYDAKNPPALLRLVGQGVELHPYPKDVMLAARRATFELYEAEAKVNADFAAIYRPWKAFRDTAFQWFKVNEAAYANFNYYVK